MPPKRPPLPIRVRKARANQVVKGCGHFVKHGEIIISLNGEPWICYECRQYQKQGLPYGKKA